MTKRRILLIFVLLTAFVSCGSRNENSQPEIAVMENVIENDIEEEMQEEIKSEGAIAPAETSSAFATAPDTCIGTF